jgi:hypothetical protein
MIVPTVGFIVMDVSKFEINKNCYKVSLTYFFLMVHWNSELVRFNIDLVIYKIKGFCKF